jgi:hypothetical protein
MQAELLKLDEQGKIKELELIKQWACPDI